MQKHRENVENLQKSEPIKKIRWANDAPETWTVITIYDNDTLTWNNVISRFDYHKL